MHQAKIFIHIHDRWLEKQLIALPALQKFKVVESAKDGPSWSEQFQACGANALLLEWDEALAKPLNSESGRSLLAGRDYILFSRGEPNRTIDTLLAHCAGYHMRAPYSLDGIERALYDFYNRLKTSQRGPQQIMQSELEQYGLLVGASQCMQNLYRTVGKVARSNANVLISGESGAGKELVASTIHSASDRANKPFVALNCGAISPELVDSELFGHVRGAFTGALRAHKGVFEQAERGTLFLDEVTEMPLEQQVKLLRVLESGEFRPVGSQQGQFADVRVIAATNRDIQEAVQQGALRADLYYRLAQFPIKVPALRDRENDITGLAKHFLAYRNAQEKSAKSITPAALRKIAAYHWPGNVRELKHAIERAYILADECIDEAHLHFENTDAPFVSIPGGMPLKELEAAAIRETLERNQGNKRSTAEQLGISVKTLYNKLERSARS